ncbi:hypothetical protein [Fonticella tunisiensis]|uniref:ParB-like nuclease family protein n=1 Tax=Fonticella tunisiensis TaxID=1096341 RepID=A0A4R7KSJ8_9CLOT|nr:hypothetical protein [Fonticella tunisiensis]TDT58389.1 hypothetical protein EDD71_11123 [Fonticella tunisiensis]
MSELTELSILDIQPSQLFISNEKLMAIYKWLNAKNDYNYDPIPVKYLNGKIIFTDGHTRALALYKLGFEKIRVFWDTDELNWEAYQICVDWCVNEGITNISHLDNRILDGEQYEILWYDRCRKMQAELEERRLQ